MAITDLAGKIKSFFQSLNPFKDQTTTIYAKDNPSYQYHQQPRGGGQSPQASPTPLPSVAPGAYQHSLPVSYPGMNQIPQTINYNDRGGQSRSYNLAQGLMENFDDIKQATAAASMLAHGNEQTYTPDEIQRFGRDNYNYGENPRFEVIADSQQENGTWDKGIARTNTGTFDEMLANPFWKKRLSEQGVSSWEDLDSPEKNLRVARTMLEYANWDKERQNINSKPRWNRWYNAPLKNRVEGVSRK